MGKKAKKAPVQTKGKTKLAKRFKCPFCANEDVVECKMDNKKGIGSLSCRLCGASYQMPIHHLHEPIDVFSEWLDDCEAAERANNGGAPPPGMGGGGGFPASVAVGGGGGVFDADQEDDDLLDEPSGLHAGKKKGGGGAQENSIDALGLGGDSDSDDD